MSSRLDPNRVFSGMATEHTLKEVVKAVSQINLNVGDIIVGDISVQSDDTTTHSLLTTTNTKLDTLNTTVINKHLNYETDSVTVTGGDSVFNVSDADTHTTLTTISNTLTNKHLNFETDSVTVTGNVNVNVEKVVEPVLYNLQIVGTQMYADSINGAIVDTYGRDGWFWTNSATTGGSNAYWYSNTIVPQNQMTKAQIECVYVILALDRVQPNIVLPIFPMYSLPTGSGDIAPGFAHSSWTYVIPATNILNAGEVVMFTIGDHTKVDKIRPELRRVHLELLRTNGDALSTEVIGLISLNTDSGTKPQYSIQYLLQNAGFHYSVTDKIVEYEFNNGVQNAININLNEGGIKIRNTVAIDGNVNVANFPISQAVTGTFWQSTQPVSGSVSVSNLPATQPVSGSVSVSNLPAVQTVDGSVGISNFPNTQAVTGTVNIGNLPTTQPVSGSVSVSNFPASQAVTGTFWQETQPVSGTFWQATQPVSGSVSVSNLPATQPVSGSVNVDNFPASQAVTGTFWQATQPVSGSVSVSNLPATQPVSGLVSVDNFPASQAVTGTFWQATQPVSGSVSVSNLPTTQAVSGTVGISNFPASQAVTGTFWQATQPVSGSVSVSNLPTTQNVNGSVSISNFPATQAVSGNVTVNTISGFALESGGNLASIKTNTDKIKSDTTNTDAIQVQVKNSSIPVTGTFWQATQPVSGTVAVSNTGFNVNNFPASQAVTGDFYPTTQPVSGTVAVSNTGFNVNNFPASTNSHTQAYDPSAGGGYFDITSTSISATVSALDVAVKNTVPVTGTFYQETQPVSGNVTVNTISGFAVESGGNLASIKTNTDKIKSDTTNTDAIQVQVKNSSIPVSGTITANIAANQRVLSNVYDWQNNGITSTNHTINKYGLDTTSALATTDMNNRYLLTSTLNGAKQSLDVNVANTVAVTGAFYQETQPVSIANGSTTNFDSATGINVYQILPKIKQYTIGGFDEQNSIYRLFGLATGGGINTTTTDFGLVNPRVHYGGISSGFDRDAYIDYVDPSGNLIENSGPYTFNTTYAILPSMIAPIKFRLTSNLSGGQAVYISTTQNSSVGAVAGMDQNQYCIGTFTVPNGYIGYISHLSSTVGATTNIQIVKWDVNGVRSVVYRFNNTGISSHTAGYEGSLGGIFYAGETIAFSNQTAVASKSCFGNMILKSIL